ncbi:hypothetical protein QR680_013120 [Steinernema hermaphroditum]|uniref:Mediator of RNA polymerase II transcription subunit 1 n=1 Tax=Steinernema hermaphroditum TaxID=289476 RepID=A0AA39M1S2_9BILA|nr:hypothetical protein QR680_013120 [Steinernema hermaphroditum]
MFGFPKDEPMDVGDEKMADYDPLQMFSIAQVDSASRIDTVRNKNPQNCDFDHLAKNLRKNMMDKKIVLETDTRAHLLASLKTLRKTFLGDSSVDFQSRLKMLADVLNCQLLSQPCYYELKRMELMLGLRLDGPACVGVCTISWFQEKPQPCENIRKLLQENKWGELEMGLSRMLQIMPSRLSPPDLELCLRALSITEKDLLLINGSSDSTLTPMERVNQLPVGLCQPRTALTPFTIYFLADPILFRAAGDSSPEEVLKKLPQATLCIIESNNMNILPETSNVDPRTCTWLQKLELSATPRYIRATFCLKLSYPILFLSQMVSNLVNVGAELVFSPDGTSLNYFHTILATTSTTLYSRLSDSFAVRFSLEPTMNVMSALDQAASVVSEIRVHDPRQIPVIVHLVRQQLVFNSLMEGISRSCSPLSSLTAHAGNPKVIKDVRMGISLESSMIEMDFQHNKKKAVARVNVASHGMGIMIEFMDQTPFDVQALFGAQQLMNLTWSLPLVMHGVLSSDSKVVDYDRLVKAVVERGEAIVKAPSKDFGVSFDDKVGDAWLCIFKKRKRKQSEDAIVPSKSSNELILEIDTTLVLEGGISFLASFKELDPEEELLCPPPPQRTTFGVDMSASASLRVPDLSAARSMRLSTDGMALNNALSDLDAIAEMGNDDTDSVVSENSGRSSTVERCSPSTTSMGFKNALATTPQSPSELQRQRLALQQSMGVQATGATSSAMAQMDLRMKLMQNQQMHQQTPPLAASSDVFDFTANEDSNGSGQNPSGSTPSSGNATPFTSGTGSASSMVVSPFQFPSTGFSGNAGFNARGMPVQAAPKRRGRARKAANLGDRQLSLDSLSSPVLDAMGNPLSSQLPASGIGSRGGKQRGAAATRRPRKPRRGSVSATGSHTHQFSPFMGMAGQIQRPFPDLSQPSFPPQLRPSDPSISSANDLDYEDESSDGETDPPPPPKSALPPNLPPAASSAPVLTPSVTPPVPKTASAATSFSALISERSNSSSPLVSVESVQIQKIINEEAMSSKPTSPLLSKGRKSSLESLISKTHSAPPPPNRLDASDLYDDGTRSRTPTPPPVIPKRESPRPSSAADSGGAGGKIVLKILQKPGPMKAAKVETPRMSAGQPPSTRVAKESAPSRSKHQNSSSSRSSRQQSSDDKDSKGRKSSKRKGTESGGSSSKKQRASTGTTATASPTTVPTNALPFGFTNTALPKSFKIPKVNEPPETSASNPTSSSSSKPPILSAPSQHATGPNTIPLPTSQPPRPKSILKTSANSLDQPNYSPLGFAASSGVSGRRTLLPVPGTPVSIPSQPSRSAAHPPAPTLQPKRPSVAQFPQNQFFTSAPQLQRFSAPSSQSFPDDMDFSRDSPGGEEGTLRIVDDTE